MLFKIIGGFAMRAAKIPMNRKSLDIDVIGDREGAISVAEGFGNVSEILETPTGITIFVNKDGERFPVEAELIEKREHTAKLYDAITTQEGFRVAADIDWLYFLKMSHRYKKNSPHFWKTVMDIRKLKDAGAKMPEGSDELFKEREKLTYDYSHPKLNVSKNEFFSDDGIKYIYDHDDLHRILALGSEPAYKTYLKDGSPVLTDKNKFFNSSYETKLFGFIEESLVLAAERSLIPFDFKPDKDSVFKFAMSKVCSSITSGYFREWCYDNIFEAMKYYKNHISDSGWVEKIKVEIEKGTLKSHKT